ncbi:MAG: amino acid decarboxylase, partial [Saprospiraceae bacterium]
MINETLDPEDWEQVRALGHRMMDDVIDYLKNIRAQPVWKPIPDDIKQVFDEPLPQTGMSSEEVYEQFKSNVLPYNKGNIHPRFWAWVQGTGT